MTTGAGFRHFRVGRVKASIKFGRYRFGLHRLGHDGVSFGAGFCTGWVIW